MNRPKALLDSSVWIEFFGRGKKLKSVQRVMTEFRIVGVPSLVFFEVCRKISKNHSSELALSVASFLRQYGSLNLTDEIALHAADLSNEWKIGMADSIMLAHSFIEEATLITLDNDFAGIPKTKVLRS
jgi:predicted nucleic acid-binding protein